MDKGSNGRNGKIVSAGHSSRIEGLNKFLVMIERWPEITTIRIGPIQQKKGNGPKRVKRDSPSEGGLRAVQSRERAKGSSAFSFKATRLAVVGTCVTGINCQASYGSNVQLVVLTSNDIDVLKSRLRAEGFGANW